MTSHICAILLAGGIGSRMKSEIPKQFLPLHGRPLINYSIDLFAGCPLSELVIVCDPAYRSCIELTAPFPIRFALPGERRQDSLWNAVQSCTSRPLLYCIHDAARPLARAADLDAVLEAAALSGAALLATPATATIKEASQDGCVARTLDRSRLWEAQTPQAIRADILHAAFTRVHEEGISITDDVALAELVGCKVKLVEGNSANLKITTAEDLLLAEALLKIHERV